MGLAVAVLIPLIILGLILLLVVAAAAVGVVWGSALIIIGFVKKKRQVDTRTDDSEACIYGGILIALVGAVVLIAVICFAARI